MSVSTGERMKITILGARGSVPAEGEDMLEFGGATSCVLIQTGDDSVFFDAGTGIMKCPNLGNSRISLFLTHPHIDHLMGFPFFPCINEKDRIIDIYAVKSGDESAKKQFANLLSPPLWPARAEDYPADIRFHDITFPVKVGNAVITGIPSVHPGGGWVYKFKCGGKSVVYATDYEYDEGKVGELIDFAFETDLLLMDAQYTEEEFEKKRGFGHSSHILALEIAKKCRAKKVRFVHHDPTHTDEFLRKMEAQVKAENTSFARRGEVIDL